jgi:hypothetical protein
MKNLFFLLSGYLIILVACNQHASVDGNATASVPFQDTVVPEPEIKIDPRTTIDQIIFGRYCGECAGICAPMYRYSAKGNQNSFYADYTDSFWKDTIRFGTALNDALNFKIGSEIIAAIPDSLFITEKQKFGCPDCTDGCGLYFEMSDFETLAPNKTKKFRIDAQTEQLTGQIRGFAELLMSKLPKIVDANR